MEFRCSSWPNHHHLGSVWFVVNLEGRAARPIMESDIDNYGYRQGIGEATPWTHIFLCCEGMGIHEEAFTILAFRCTTRKHLWVNLLGAHLFCAIVKSDRLQYVWQYKTVLTQKKCICSCYWVKECKSGLVRL